MDITKKTKCIAVLTHTLSLEGGTSNVLLSADCHHRSALAEQHWWHHHTKIHAVRFCCLSYWIKYVPHAILFLLTSKTACTVDTKCRPFTTIIIHFTCTMVWVKFDSFLQHGFFFQSFADCRHPVGIISSINTTQRHSVHSSLKESTGISLARSVWEMMKRRSEDSFYIYIYTYISHHLVNHCGERCSTAMKSLKYFYHDALTAQPENSGVLCKTKHSAERMWQFHCKSQVTYRTTVEPCDNKQ